MDAQTPRSSVLAPRTLLLAPHFDDVALSAGGTAARLAAGGSDVVVVTIFGGTPENETALTPWARWLVAQWGVASLGDAIRARRAEDAAAVASLGATLHTLSFVDGAFRGGRYPDWAAMQTELVADEANVLPQAIAAALAATGLFTPDTTVVGPLAVGMHVDHQATLAAMRLLAPSVSAVWGYEDFPYAVRQNGFLPARLAALDLVGTPAETVDIAPWLDTKIRAIATYTSQMGELFGDGDMPAIVRDYAADVAGGAGYAERFWQLSRHRPTS